MDFTAVNSWLMIHAFGAVFVEKRQKEREEGEETAMDYFIVDRFWTGLVYKEVLKVHIVAL